MSKFLIRQPLQDISTVSSEKGSRTKHPITGKPSQHAGIDIVPGSNLEVIASHNGVYQINNLLIFISDKL